MIFVVDHRAGYEMSLAPPYVAVNLVHLTGDRYRTDNAFAELRAHYAVWQDRTDLPWVGFAHYRRRLVLGDEPSRLMESYDVVTTRPEPYLVREHYIGSHGQETWDIFETVLAEVGYPWRSIDTFHGANLYIMRWPLFDAYMRQWFAVMERLSARIVPVRGDYQERVFGFLAERLWSLWYSDIKSTVRHLEVSYQYVE